MQVHAFNVPLISLPPGRHLPIFNVRIVIMSPRPGTIKRTVRVDLPRPRDRTSPALTDLRKSIYREFFTNEEVPGRLRNLAYGCNLIFRSWP